MIDAVQRVVLRVFRVLPRRVRRWIVRFGTPKYTVGAICIVQRRDGAILLVRHSYAPRWGTPGGLAKRREPVDIAAARETLEEVNLAVELIGEPVVVVEPVPRRVDVVFLARPAATAALDDVRPSSPEIVGTAWFLPDELPELQPETATALVALARDGRIDLAGSGLTPSSARPTR
ncbi:MAG TPA: NUDIX domain-containing protein [Microthrixaceae bacterium]|nr:NUDIX domain-containing protein [Microthrixaceae bacterium]